jgi:hypothetical protein
MVQRDVVRHEVEEEAESPLLKTLSKERELVVASD